MDFIQKALDSISSAWIAALSFALAAFLMSVIEVSKIKINPWSALRKIIADFFMREYIDNQKVLERRFSDIQELLMQHVLESDRREADKNRRYILNFERAIQSGIQHSKEEFEDVLEVISRYETYCEEHLDYKNHITTESANHIREVYRARLRNRTL